MGFLRVFEKVFALKLKKGECEKRLFPKCGMSKNIERGGDVFHHLSEFHFNYHLTFSPYTTIGHIAKNLTAMWAYQVIIWIVR
jgi:hypothetical protein